MTVTQMEIKRATDAGWQMAGIGGLIAEKQLTIQNLRDRGPCC